MYNRTYYDVYVFTMFKLPSVNNDERVNAKEYCTVCQPMNLLRSTSNIKTFGDTKLCITFYAHIYLDRVKLICHCYCYNLDCVLRALMLTLKANLFYYCHLANFSEIRSFGLPIFN